jgi:DNA helicase-2/ATP-dependent DNA helicase PcrA
MWESLSGVSVSGRARNSINDFKNMIELFAKRAAKDNAYEVASYIARQSGLIDLLKADTTIEGMNRLENLNALLDGIKDFVENDEVIDGQVTNDKSLAAYIQNIALLTDLDDETKTSGDFVTLMSVHSAKGLEYKSIFVVGLEEKLFPSFMSMESADGIDEERRLFYVAITRAESFLTLTFANSRYHFGKMRYNDPSRFLEEISSMHLESSFALNQRGSEAASLGAKVIGNFKKPRTLANATLKADPATFKPNPSHEIQAGMKVLHLKFGKGKVLSIDGNDNNRVATIFFNEVDNPQRRIMLKFAKLQILS